MKHVGPRPTFTFASGPKKDDFLIIGASGLINSRDRLDRLFINIENPFWDLREVPTVF